MFKKIIRHFLNKRGYEIIRKKYIGKPYPAIIYDDSILYKTHIGNYHFPLEAKKDGVLKVMSHGRVHDEEIVDVAKKYIQPGTAVLDIGANFGQMSILFSQMVGPTGKVYAFEAQNRVFKYLKKNIDSNNCLNVIAKDGAVYNVSGKTLFFPEPNFNTYNPFSGNAINPILSNGQKVVTFTIDDLNIAEQISFLKVDIQGADIFALQGAKQTILKNKMPIIFEFEQQFQSQFNTSFQDYVDFVNEVGYVFADVPMNGNYLLLPK